MPQINQLASTDQLYASDLVPVYASANGDARKASMWTVLQFIEQQLNQSDDDLSTQYGAPNTFSFSIAVSPPVAGQSTYLLLTPTGSAGSGTIVLPALASCKDGQELLVSSTQAITALTVSGDAPINGAPTSLAANGFFKLRFDDVLSSWFRVG